MNFENGEYPVLAFDASARTDARDRSGEVSFANLRAAGWWTLSERLDPTSKSKPLALPQDDCLIGDLTAPGGTGALSAYRSSPRTTFANDWGAPPTWGTPSCMRYQEAS